jgi:hypothetical protein
MAKDLGSYAYNLGSMNEICADGGDLDFCYFLAKLAR